MKKSSVYCWLLLCLVAVGCRAQVYTISKGNHFSSPRSLKFHTGVSSQVRTVVFDSTCVYRFGDAEDGDINKLYGWGVGLTNRHSIRIGWNCKSGEGIDLYAYFHVNGRRWMVPRDSSSSSGRADLIGKGFIPGLPISCGIHRARDGISFEAVQGSKRHKLFIRYRDFPNGPGQYMYPYFGGTYPAPQTMRITLR